jgi:uncharacterized heparinase superfamily protein
METVVSGVVGKMRWYFDRLLAMSVPEVGHRLHELLKRRVSALRTFESAKLVVETAVLPAFSIDRDRLLDVSDDVLAIWRSVAPRAGAPGAFLALGHTFPISAGIDWHRDPETGRSWPKDTYCFDIDYRHTRLFGDVKLVWELNRLQFVPILAALSVVDGDRRHADLALDLIERWIDDNPPYKGINWVSGIELALRAVSILLTIGIVGRENIPMPLARKIAQTLAAHTYWLERFPSRYSSANNHLIAEQAALFVLGTLSADRAGREWAEAARRLLMAEVDRQIHDDGVGAEQSPTYTAFTCEWYLLAFLVAEQVGRPFPRETLERVGHAGEWLRWLLDEGGHHPRIGDDDEGRVVGSGVGQEPCYVASVLDLMAGVLRRSDLAVAFGSPQLRNLCFWSAVGAASSPVGLRIFEQGGYTVWRRQLGGRDALAVLDHGPLGYLAIAAHGHADALSLTLHLDGQPVLVDAGTYLYHAGGAMRDRLRGTAVHNTLCVDGVNQSQIASAFNWRRKAQSRLVSADEGRDESQCVTAQHDGYRHAYGLMCERTVCVDDNGLTVADSLIGSEKGSPSVSSIRIGFLLHPDCQAEISGSLVVVRRGGHVLMRLIANADLDPELEDAEYSPAFGVLQRTTRIVFAASNVAMRQFCIRIDIVSPDAPMIDAGSRLQPSEHEIGRELRDHAGAILS